MKKDSSVAESWGIPIEPSLRMKEIIILFRRLNYKTAPTEKIVLGDGFVQVTIDINSDKDRFGVPEFGTYRFYLNENRVERK